MKTMDDWPLKKTPPDEYLADKPDGKHAELAREILLDQMDDAVPEGMEPVTGLGYSIGSWGGHVNYVCNLCDVYSTLSVEAIRSHVAHHAAG